MPSQDLRTKKTYDKYMSMIAKGLLDHGCRLCQIKPIKQFKYWKIINNDYPWDLVAKTNHILVSKRHITYEKLNQVERKEFDVIKAGYIEKNYGHIVETTNKRKSIPSHFHVHLLVLKNRMNLK
jgi:predicted nucleic acid-binding OB-fold protein